ncbi:MAG: hypothetical protein AAB194_04455, partial [Pseudomonadota bacterium]
GHIPRSTLFGRVIKLINEADASSPLANLKPIVTDLDELNDYVGQFHHDTDIATEHVENSVEIRDGELVMYARLALQLIYKGVR